jgi:hypothetical protein
MRKTIVRTITATTIESAKITFEKGLPVVTPNAPITVNGVIAEDKALKEVRKEYGENAQVTAITSIDNVYEITVEDFMKYAKKVENPTPEQTTEGTNEQEVNNADKQ